MSLECAYQTLINKLLADRDSAEDVAMIDKQVYRLRIERVPTEKIPEVVDEHLNTTA